MRYCIGYEGKERNVDAASFQMGQGGWDAVQAHAVLVEGGRPMTTTVCTIGYKEVNVDLDWFDPKYAYALKRCDECERLTQ